MSRLVYVIPTEEIVRRLYMLYTSLDDMDMAERFEFYIAHAVTAARISPPSAIDVSRLRERLGYGDPATVFLTGLEEFVVQLHEVFHDYDLYNPPDKRRMDFRFDKLTGDDIVMIRNERPRQAVDLLEIIENGDCYPRI